MVRGRGGGKGSRAVARLAIAAVGLALGSCDDGNSGTPADMGSGGTGGGGIDPLPGLPSSGTCHSLDGAGASTVTDQIASSVPAMSGGSITDGTYYLTRYEWFEQNTLHSRRIVIQFANGGQTAQYLWIRNSEPEERASLYITASGERIAMRVTCPTGRDLEWDRYSANGDGLILYSSRDNKAAYFSRR